MQKSLKETVFDKLKQDERIRNKEKNELNQTLLIDLLDKIDEKIINILLDCEEIRGKFFVKIKDVYVFKTNDFKFFLEENRVYNSYTSFKNRIGLSDGKRFLNESQDVVLNFPFKDCVLEGGQSSEEGLDTYFEFEEEKTKTINGEKTIEESGYKEKTAKRNEIFFNEILAKDEIDRLFDKKAFVNFKKFDKDGEKEVKGFTRDENGTIKDNLLIKGNNLLALHSLKSQFAGKVKLIYIDPPYNTGNDGFKYNDNFNHSTWLTFMKNRLEVARELLRDDGVIFVQCDYRQNAYLRILMNDIFKNENFINEICWKKYSGVKNQASNRLTTQHETIFIFSKSNIFRPMPVYNPLSEKYVNDEYKYTDEQGRRYAKLRGRGYQDGNSTTKIKYLDENLGSPITTLWSEDKLQLNTSSSEKLNDFVGQKPEELIKRIIELSTHKNDLVLDYHLGSGTTAAVAHKMNRQYIGIEQMDYIETMACERMKKVIAGEQGGISKSVNWQGGGSFIYFELAKHNETAKEKILSCKNLNDLTTLFDELYEKYFLNYNLKIKEFKEKVLQEKEFENLDLNQQKQMFLTMLDLNQMYVNESGMEDKSFALKDEDIKLTKDFYGK